METSGITAKAAEPMMLGADDSLKIYERPVVLELEPDSYEFSTAGKEGASKKDKVSTLIKKGTVGALAVSASAGKIGQISTKFSDWVTKGLTQMAADFGRNADKLPKTLSPAVKYGAMLLGTAATFLLATKDSDKDGKLDVLESVGKLFNPAA